jgi:MFS family permease
VKAVLRLPSYRPLLAVYALNELAWSVGSLALAVLVYRRTASAWAATAFFLALQFVPAFVAPLLVAGLDRRGARRVLVSLYALQGLVFLVLAGTTSHFELVLVLVLVLAGGIVNLGARPIARATTAGVISPAGLLREGNAVTNAAFAICIMVGPVIGGALVGAGGTTTGLLVVTGMFLAISLTLMRTRGLPVVVPPLARSRDRLRAAVGLARNDAVIARLLVLQAVALVFFSVSVPVEVVFAQHSLHAGAGGYGALLFAWGAGAIAGSAVYAYWRALPAWLLIALGSVAIGLGFLLMAAASTLVLAAVGSAVGGLGNGIEAVAERTALQERVEQRWMALMMSLNESMFQALPGAGILLGGGLAALAGPRAAFALGGAGALVVGVLAPVVLRGTRGAPVPDPADEIAGSYSEMSSVTDPFQR